MTKITFFKDRWTGIGSVKENDIFTIHLASDLVQPKEDCGSYAFGSLPPLVDKNINVLMPAYQTLSPPLIQFSTVSDVSIVDAVLQTSVLCTRVAAQDHEVNHFQVYPNPASTWIHVPIGEPYQIMNSQGQIISECKSEGNVAVFQLPAGAYMLLFQGKFYKFIRL